MVKKTDIPVPPTPADALKQLVGSALDATDVDSSFRGLLWEAAEFIIKSGKAAEFLAERQQAEEARRKAAYEPQRTAPVAGIKKQKRWWTTRDGTRLRICDMTDSHLVNALRFLKRAAINRQQDELAMGFGVLGMLGGEEAQRCCEQELDELGSQEWWQIVPDEFFDMRLEAKRRGLLTGDNEIDDSTDYAAMLEA